MRTKTMIAIVFTMLCLGATAAVVDSLVIQDPGPAVFAVLIGGFLIAILIAANEDV